MPRSRSPARRNCHPQPARGEPRDYVAPDEPSAADDRMLECCIREFYCARFVLRDRASRERCPRDHRGPAADVRRHAPACRSSRRCTCDCETVAYTEAHRVARSCPPLSEQSFQARFKDGALLSNMRVVDAVRHHLLDVVACSLKGIVSANQHLLPASIAMSARRAGDRAGVVRRVASIGEPSRSSSTIQIAGPSCRLTSSSLTRAGVSSHVQTLCDVARGRRH